LVETLRSKRRVQYRLCRKTSIASVAQASWQED
jgi:hypothetical protein